MSTGRTIGGSRNQGKSSQLLSYSNSRFLGLSPSNCYIAVQMESDKYQTYQTGLRKAQASTTPGHLQSTNKMVVPARYPVPGRSGTRSPISCAIYLSQDTGTETGTQTGLTLELGNGL